MFPLWGPQASAPTFWAEGWVRIQAKVAGRNPDSIFAASMSLRPRGEGGLLSPALQRPCSPERGLLSFSASSCQTKHTPRDSPGVWELCPSPLQASDRSRGLKRAGRSVSNFGEHIV